MWSALGTFTYDQIIGDRNELNKQLYKVIGHSIQLSSYNLDFFFLKSRSPTLCFPAAFWVRNDGTTARRVEFCAILNHLEGLVLDALRRVYSVQLHRQREITAAEEVATAREGYDGTKDDTHDTTKDEATSQSELVLTTLSAGLPSAQTYVLANHAAFNDGYRRPIAETPVSSRPQIQLPKRLMQSLFNAFVHIPYYNHPIIPYDKLRSRLVECSWQLSSLSPPECVLLYCIFAVTSLVSIDPLIIGPELLSAEFISILTTVQPVKTIKLDLRDIGRRRERRGLCHQLRAEALRQAQIEGIALWVSPESAASCYLLDALLGSERDSPNTYDATFSWQARTLAESWYRQEQPFSSNIGSMVRSIKWACFLVIDAISALHSDRSVAFSAHDEHLVCGHIEQLPLEKLASPLSQGCDCMQFYDCSLSVLFHITSGVREVYKAMGGSYARSRRFDFQAVKRYFTYLRLLYEVCAAYSALGHLLSRQVQSQSLYILSTVRVLSIGWTNLTLYFYKRIKAILEEGIVTVRDAALDDSFPVPGVDCYGSGSRDTGHDSFPPTKLAPIFVDARVLTCKAAIEFSEMIEDIHSVSRLAQLKIVGGHLKGWVQFTVNVTDAGVMSASDGIQVLERLRDALKIAGFAWTDDTGFIEDIDSHIAALWARVIPATARDST
ncbi:hypothetical protein D9758_007925 [Tetrapyrgos nigripes]|uniref:Uncharacterized protein n=1 Tax=Tetrapyrgos nigripes TaxID=182062 RepID=A0A8H5D3J9_9AGAR|nr:hypothetical protein D9758_007925 [Tetrapyrgos nigripes]